jgi:Asp-tRNA(Asn)/Glu-tRNA(Gln) amidotransferase A subunit family amidase
MALSWTQDRLGPICRYAEDCAIVMQAIARPDGRDMSVSDLPFNWDAQLDVKKLRVGIIKESFDELTNDDAKRNAQQLLDALKSLGVATRCRSPCRRSTPTSRRSGSNRRLTSIT